MVFEVDVKGRILIEYQFQSILKEYTLIGMQRMAQRIPTTHATNAHLVCAYADTTSRTLHPLPRTRPCCIHVCMRQSGQTWNFVFVYTNTCKTFYTCPSSCLPPSLSMSETDRFSVSICRTNYLAPTTAIYPNKQILFTVCFNSTPQDGVRVVICVIRWLLLLKPQNFMIKS